MKVDNLPGLPAYPKKTSWFSIATVQLAGAAYPEAPEVLQGGAPVSDSSLNLSPFTHPISLWFMVDISMAIISS